VFGEPPAGKVQFCEATTKERFSKVVMALRLFKQGRVGTNIIRIKHQSAILTGISGLGLSSKSFWGSPPSYTLTETEVEEFQNFWKFYVYLEQPAPVHNAINRFNQAYERGKPEDKFMDYMIAFESLLLTGVKQKVHRNFVNRSSKLLKQNKHMMDRIYKKRSAVVHGEKAILDPKFVEMVEDYLRKSIKLFLEQLQTKKTYKDIISHLDRD